MSSHSFPMRHPMQSKKGHLDHTRWPSSTPTRLAVGLGRKKLALCRPTPGVGRQFAPNWFPRCLHLHSVLALGVRCLFACMTVLATNILPQKEPRVNSSCADSRTPSRGPAALRKEFGESDPAIRRQQDPGVQAVLPCLVGCPLCLPVALCLRSNLAGTAGEDGDAGVRVARRQKAP